MSCEKKGKSKIINLESELINETMALNTRALEGIGGSVQFGIGGRRGDQFWIVMAVIAAGILIGVGVFSKKKRRR